MAEPAVIVRGRGALPARTFYRLTMRITGDSAGPDPCWFLRHGGECARHLREQEAAESCLGPCAQWPAALKHAVQMVLESRMPMMLHWGPDLITFYNDAYAELLADKHPGLLGARAEPWWREIWAELSGFFARVWQGESVFLDNAAYDVVRGGMPMRTYFTHSHSPVRDADGAVAGILVVAQENTGERVRWQQQSQANARLTALLSAQETRLQRGEEMSRLVLQSMANVGTWDWWIDEDQVHADRNVATMFGVPIDQAADGLPITHFFQRMHPEDLPRVRRHLEMARTSGEAGLINFRLRRPDGDERWMLARFQGVVPDAHGVNTRIIGVNVDITDQQELELQLRQAQKMEAVGQLTGGLAHDFNNLLSAVSGALQILRRRVSADRLNPDEITRLTGIAQGAVDRAATLTHRLLAFSRQQTLTPHPTDVNRLVAGMEPLLAGTLPPDIEIRIDSAPDLWPALVDASQLENALLNLCVNARDAMPGGGRLTIVTDNTVLDAAQASEAHLIPGEYLTLCVIDTGTGMDSHTTERAFDPFFTTKDPGQGTGLGLSMVYGFARQSGGHVTIQSTPGEGTTFCLYLPRHQGTLGDAHAPVASAAQPAHALTGRILLVDDEPDIRMLLADVLRESGHEVRQAAEAHTALALLRTCDSVNLLMTDVGLPGGMDGRQLAEAARQAHPDISVLFITGYAENAIFADGHLDPNMRVLTKPFNIETLLDVVDAMLKARGQ